MQSPETWMPNRVVRIPDHIWDAAKARAAERDETISQAIRQLLAKYAR